MRPLSILTTGLLSALLAGACSAPTAGSQAPGESKVENQVENQVESKAEQNPYAEMQAQFEEDYAAVLSSDGISEEHAGLANYVGGWELDISMWMAPDTEVLKTVANSRGRSILGGRFLELTTHSNFMNTPVESRSLLGFDQRHGEYTLLEMDTLGTYWISAKGTLEDDGIIRLHGEDIAPAGNMVYTFEYDLRDPDSYGYRLLFHQLGDKRFDPPYVMASVKTTRVARNALVETACGQCQFDLPGDGCDLAVRIGTQAWFVDGSDIDDHGDAHAADGFCNAVRLARTTGRLADGRFAVSSLRLVEQGHDE